MTDGVPPAVNHASGIRRLTLAIERVLGAQAITSTEQSLGGEDFLDAATGAGCACSVGSPHSRTEVARTSTSPHSSVDERCIPAGLKVLAEVATTSQGNNPRVGCPSRR